MAFASVQAEEVTKKVTFSSYTAGTQYAKNEKHDLGDGLVIYTTECHFTSELRIYSSSTHNGFVVSDALPGTITKMEFNAGNKADNLVVYGSNDGSSWTEVGKVSVASDYKDYSLTFTGSYTRFKLDVEGANQIRLKSMSVTYTKGGETPEPDPEEPETPVAPDAPTLTASCNFDNSMLVEITNIAEGATAYYTTDGTDPTEESTMYTAPFEITATTTVKAIAVANSVASDVAEATYTKVTPPAEGETVEVVDVLNRALTGITSTTYSSWSGKTVTSSAVYAGQSAGGNDAIQLRSSNSNSGIITTTSGGKVKKVVVVWNSNTTDGRTLNIYGKNNAYTAATDLYDNKNQGTLLGTIVKGTSTEFVIDGEYEYIGLRSYSNAMYLTSISITWEASAGVTPVAPVAPRLTESQTFKGSMEVTITSDATVYYTTDGSEPSATNGAEYTKPFEITATTTVKAVAVNEVGESEVAEATYTLFVVEETEGYYVKVTSEPTDWTGKYLIVYEDGTNAYVFNGKDEANGYVDATIDGAAIKANAELDAVAVTIATMEGGYSIKTANGYIYGNNNSNKLQFNTTAEQLNTIAIGIDGVDIIAGRYLRFNSASGDMRFRYYNITYGEPVQLYKYMTELPSYTLAVSAAGYATLYLDFNATIPEGVEAYTVTAVNNGYVTLTPVEGAIPANTGVIIKANKGDYIFNYVATATAVSGNLLKGSIDDKDIQGEAYVLGVVDGEIGLYKAEMNGTAWKNNANKAYLPVSAFSNAQNVASFSFRFEGTTAVEEVEVENAETIIYDLAGRRIEKITQAGIYIIGGNKVLVK